MSNCFLYQENPNICHWILAGWLIHRHNNDWFIMVSMHNDISLLNPLLEMYNLQTNANSDR